MRRLVNVGGCRLYKEKIHQAVLIVVEPAHTGAHRLQIIFFFSLGGVLNEGDSCLLANIRISDGNGGLLRFSGLAGEQQMGGRAKYCGKR